MRARDRAIGLVLLAGVCATPLMSGCADAEGIVEVYWQFEDQNLVRIFPQGRASDSCGFVSASGIRYDLVVRLSVVENSDACAATPDDAACQVIEPVLFPCNRQRGTADPVPVSARDDGTDPGYLMLVDTLIDPTDSQPFLPNSDCVIGPGPRVRKVRPGRITDLEVYEFIIKAVSVSNYALDIDSCR